VSSELKKERDSDKNLVYAPLEGYGLVFLPVARARFLAATYHAISASKTWGEVRRSMPAKAWSDVRGMLEDEEIPADDAKFDGDAIPGFGDGDWPGFPAQEMLQKNFLPKDVIDLGAVRDTVLNGSYLELPESLEPRILELLRAHGYTVTKDVELMTKAQNWA